MYLLHNACLGIDYVGFTQCVVDKYNWKAFLSDH
uniref:Uncharacterized protein n=1 Tax=Rhizophora mucronata TaxID=61149 RepID=A0A2P2QM63_RHIMU